MVAAPPPVPAPVVAVTPTPLEEKAKRLAEFFNGEVIADLTDDVA
jgi:hypothetical protein